ncbi:glycerophosphodiester phosphodiesterase family protein [Rheinheimera sp.]|uniref:glycerophosphodiester phosphodiesterase family protein n=1 Tax=Rheinheimera sp. TaxID=1869214 RepID=UPI00307F5354
MNYLWLSALLPLTAQAACPDFLVVAHRGASGHLPEHTLEAYQLAMKMGADFIEPDLVPTRDGVLISRHENDLTHSTNVADLPQFASRKTTKRIDGMEVTGWFAEDFSLAEIKQLKAREPLPQLRPQGVAHNDQYQLVTLAEIIAAVRQFERDTGRKVGIYPETKHPTFFRFEGKHLDGTAIHLNTSELLVQALKKHGFTDPKRVFIQSFELQNLLELKQQLMPKYRVSLPLVQLLGDTDKAYLPPKDNFSVPYDLWYHQQQKTQLTGLYGEAAALIARLPTPLDYSQLLQGDGKSLLQSYASGVGPWKSNLYQQGTVTLKPEFAALTQQFQLHPYTLRDEDNYLQKDKDGKSFSLRFEANALMQQGVQGVFSDYPDLVLAERTEWRQSCAK